MFLPFDAGLFVVFGLLLATQAMPPSAQELVDSCRLLERAFGLHNWPHLFHVQHEGVQRLFDVRVFLLVLSGLLSAIEIAFDVR